jgi:agmatinase
VLPIPYEATTTFGHGTAHGPSTIIAASTEMETYDVRTGRDASTLGIATLPGVEPDASSPEKMVDRIAEIASDILRDDKFLLSLGGEHTITVGLVRAFAQRFPGFGILQIDAHADLRDEYENSRYHHATAMRRCSEIAPVVGVGVRSYSEEEAEFIANSGAIVLPPWRLRDEPDALDDALGRLPEQVYVTIDVDGLDPSVVPGTGTPEPGGFSFDEIFDILSRLSSSRSIIGGDVVECAAQPGDRVSAFTAARLAYALMGMALG